MSIILKENKDFTWGKVSNPFGIEFSYPILSDGTKLAPILEPARNSVVYVNNGDTKELIPVLILDGQYYSNGRVSNYWYWQELNNELTLGKEDSGYGGFYQPHIKFDVKIKYEIKIK